MLRLEVSQVLAILRLELRLEWAYYPGQNEE